MSTNERSVISPGHHRQGVVLLIIVGLASVVLVLMVSFYARMRASAEAMLPVQQEAQSRLMLHAAMMYIQETSRIGWGEETYGWTDIRDGSLGPRGGRIHTGASPGSLPLPTPGGDDLVTWFSGGSYGDGFVEDSRLGRATWPMPGSVFRTEMAVMQRAPRQVRHAYAANPVRLMQEDIPGDVATFFTKSGEAKTGDFGAIAGGNVGGHGRRGLSLTVLSHGVVNNPHAVGMLDPQPVADRAADFHAGDRQVIAGTQGRAWFRIYRERLADHDGQMGPGEYGDHVVISQEDNGSHVAKNWNVFIITAGAGGTRGYRDWDDVTAHQAESLFGNSAYLFEELRAAERIAWWRVEWSATSGGNFHPDIYQTGFLINDVDAMRSRVQRSYGGHFKWIQRLDREPSTW